MIRPYNVQCYLYLVPQSVVLPSVVDTTIATGDCL